MKGGFLYISSVSVTILTVLIFVITQIGMFFHIPVNCFFVIIPIFIAIIYLKRHAKDNPNFLIHLLTLTFVVALSYYLSLNFWDTSWDGRSSHAATIILLKKGWLPLYDNYKEFAEFSNVSALSAFWGSCYFRFSEVIAANIYKITGFVESTKIFNFVMLYTVFCYSLSVLLKFNPDRKYLPYISSFIIAVNPVCVYQWFTNCVDIQLYFAFVLLLFTVINVEIKKNADINDLLMYVLTSVMLVSSKFTGGVYFVVLSTIYFIYLSVLKRNLKKFIKINLLIVPLITVLTFSPLYTNYRDYGNIFHPVAGKNKTDMMKPNIPFGFKDKNIIQRFFISNFADTLNSCADPVDGEYFMQIPYTIKIPFTINISSDFNMFYISEMRIGAFGYFWSGILLLSFFALFFLKFRNKDEKNLFILLNLIIWLSVFSNPHCWWARYVPQLWLFPVLTFFFFGLDCDKESRFVRLKTILMNFVFLACLLNSLIIFNQNFSYCKQITNAYKIAYENLKKEAGNNAKILLMTLPDEINGLIADETVRPHLEEYFGINNIIDVPFDIQKIKNDKFVTVQFDAVIHCPCYFIKIIFDKGNNYGKKADV